MGQGGSVRWAQEADDADGQGGAQELHGDKAGADWGSMPAKVSENIRAAVTAGLAKLVEEVNQ